MSPFRDLQQVNVNETEARGYVVSHRHNCVGKEYHVVYWMDGHREEGWFAENELEAT